MNEYSGILPTFESLHCEFIGASFGYCLDMPSIEHDTVCASNLGVPTDSQGINASALRSTLENWPPSKPKPKILYTVPVRVRIAPVMQLGLTPRSSMAATQQGRLRPRSAVRRSLLSRGSTTSSSSKVIPRAYDLLVEHSRFFNR